MDCKIFKNKTLGFDSTIFTLDQINKFFSKYNRTKKIEPNLIDKIFTKKIYHSKVFFPLSKKLLEKTIRQR